MSEYQYYEFRTIDEPLDEHAQHQLRDISSRATITATSFTNSYSWGDLKADPASMLARWFDAYLYFSNWGTHWLAFRLPRGVLSEEELAPYKVEVFSWRDEGRYTCLHFVLHEADPVDLVDEDLGLGSLIHLRDSLGKGDLRSLYIAWLVDLEWGCVPEEAEEPPVPPGLGELDAAHDAFVEFMQLDRDLLAVAAEASARLAPTRSSHAAMLAWVASLDSAEKDRWLVQLLEDGGAQVRWELEKRQRRERREWPRREQHHRTAGDLRRRAREHARERQERLERERAERRRREAERRAAAHRRRLADLEGREPELWSKVHELIATRKPRSYDQAALLLADLRDLADHKGGRADWEARLRHIRGIHRRKSSLLRRLDGLMVPGETGAGG